MGDTTSGPAFNPSPYQPDSTEGMVSGGRAMAPSAKPPITFNLGTVNVTLQLTGGTVPLADKAGYEASLGKLLKDGKVVEEGIAKALGPAIDKLILGGIGD
jgi:hypothetical protein